MTAPRIVEEEATKVCSRCHEAKPLDGFAKRQSMCRICAAAYQREYRAKLGKLPAGDPRHGTETGYSNHGCRCLACRRSHADKAKRRYDAKRKPMEVCPLCQREFRAQGIKAHKAAHERTDRRGRLQHKPTIADLEGPERWGPDPSSWARPGPGMVVLEVIEELSDDELDRLLAGFRPLGSGEASASEMARVDLMFGAKGGHR